MDHYRQTEGYEPTADELIDVLKNLENLAAANPALYRAIVDQIKGKSFEERSTNPNKYKMSYIHRKLLFTVHTHQNDINMPILDIFVVKYRDPPTHSKRLPLLHPLYFPAFTQKNDQLVSKLKHISSSKVV